MIVLQHLTVLGIPIRKHHGIGTYSFEKKITSMEDILITGTEDVLKEIHNIKGISKQIPHLSSKDLPHQTDKVQAG